MIAFLKKYKAFIIGLVITRVLALILSAKGVILIDENNILANVIGFLIYWFLISTFIHKLHFLKDNIKTVGKVVGLIILLIIILIINSSSDVPDNPITILVIVVFYMTFTYVILPKFFIKYKWLIFGVYGFASAIFIYYRLFSGSFELYEEHKGKLFLFFLLPIPVFICLWIYEQWKWLQSLKAEKAQAELSMLQAQVNPHFFFNTLNNLYALTIKNSEKAPEVILKLSEMMRYTIYEGKKDFVPIKDEIEYLMNYIELHKIRYRSKADIKFSNEIDSNLEIAPLLFIILLENAFKHGLEKNQEQGFIHMNLTGTKEYIEFNIKNNLEKSNDKEASGIGLTNLKRRLDLMYPNKHDLVISEDNSVYIVNLKIALK